MIELYSYQKKFKKDIYDFMRTGKHAICLGFMRMGKTVTFGSIAKDFNSHGKPALIITDRDVLLDQTGGSLENLGLNPFFIQAGCKVVSKNHLCFVAMSQTLKKRTAIKYWVDFFKWIEEKKGVIIIDEAHDQIFNHLFDSGLIDNTWVLGFTGTCARRGKMTQLGVQYEKIIQGPQPSELLKMDRLVNCDVSSFEAPNCNDVKINTLTGDYDNKALFNKFDTRALYTGVVKNYSEICDNSIFIAYCVNKMHAIKTAVEFHEAGYRVKYIVSDTGKPKKPIDTNDAGKMARWELHMENYEFHQKWFPVLSGERKKLIQDYLDGKFLGLTNVDVMTKGFDYPKLRTVIANYKTISLTRYLQSVTRGATYCEGKDSYNLLDFGGNYNYFGDPLEDRLYSLWHFENNSEGLPPIKNCGFTSDGEPIMANGKKGCNRMIPASMNICPFPDCGFVYPEKVLIECDLQTLFFDNQQKKTIKTKRIKEMSNQELHDYWESKGHNSVWIWRQLWYRGGEKSIVSFGKEYEWSSGTVRKAVEFCEKF